MIAAENPVEGYLKNKRADVTSQFGEDGVIAAIFDLIGFTNKWCLEVGAADGRWLSNTYNLLSQGWQGVLIESDEDQFAKLVKCWPDAHCVNALLEATGENCIDRILARADAPKTLDLMSIDIDGQDYYVWLELKDYTARVIVIEHAYHLDKWANDYIPPIGGPGQCGKTAMAELAKKKGYTVVCRTDCNTIAVQNNLYPKLVEGIKDADKRRNS
jgi:hypothetical protein